MIQLLDLFRAKRAFNLVNEEDLKVLVHGGAGKTPDFLVEPKFVGMKVKHQLK